MWTFSAFSNSAISALATPIRLLTQVFSSPREDQRQRNQVAIAVSSDNRKRRRVAVEDTPGAYPEEVDTIVADVPTRATTSRSSQDAYTTPSRRGQLVQPIGNLQAHQRKSIWPAVGLETGLYNIAPPKPYHLSAQNRFARADTNKSPSYFNPRSGRNTNVHRRTGGRKRSDAPQPCQPEIASHQPQTPNHAIRPSIVGGFRPSDQVNGDYVAEMGRRMKASQQPAASMWDKLKISYGYTSPSLDDIEVDRKLELSEKMVRKRVGMARLDLRRQERAEKERPPFVRKPPQELMDSIARWMQETDGAKIFSTIGRDNLDRRDLNFVVPREDDPTPWLNDNLIAGFLNSICIKGNEMYKEKAQKLGIEFDAAVPRYCSFNPQWYPKMAGPKGYEGIRNWAKRAKVGGNSMMKCGKIFIPINDGSHWTLLVIFPQRKLIRFYNSLSGYGADSQYLQKGVEFLKNELKDAFKPDDWTAAVGKSGQQMNGSDCGVFTCFNALATFYTDEPSTLVPDGEMGHARSFIAGTLINGGFKGQLELNTLYQGFETE
jgi:sentrin-specific protease 1